MTDDRLRAIRDRLDGVGEVPLDDRPAVFEQLHREVVAELDALEEV